MDDRHPLIPKLGSLVRNAAIVFAGAVVNRVLGYVFRLVIARVAVDEYGVYNLALTALNLLFIIGSAGLLTGVTRFTAVYIGQNRDDDVGRVFTTAVAVTLPVSILLSVALFFFAPWLADQFGGHAGLVPAFRIVAVLLPVTMLQEIFLAVTDGLKRMAVRVGLIDLLQNTAKIVLVLLAFRAMPAATGALVALGVSTLLSCVIAGLMAYRLAPVRLRRPLDTDLLRYSYPLIFAKFVSTFSGWTDTLVIGLLLTTSAVGVYNAALPTTTLLLVPAACILSIYLPTVAEQGARQEDASAMYHTVTRWIFMVTAPAAVFLMVFSRQILEAFFGDAYVAAAPALAILAAGFLLQAMAKPSALLLHAFKKTGPLPVIATGSVVLNLSLNVLLVPAFGIVGAAVATSVTCLATSVAMWMSSRHLVRLEWRRLGLAKPAATALAVNGLAMYALAGARPSVALLTMASGAVIAAHLILLGVARGFDRTDVNILIKLSDKLGVDAAILHRLAAEAPDDSL